jgi:hypothetical protein
MTAIDFPNDPDIDDTFTVGDITWKWNGETWRSQGTAIPGADGADGEDGAPGADGEPGPAGEANFSSFLLMGA